MHTSASASVLKALPVQFLEIENGVILKRGCTEFKVTGNGAGEILHLLWVISSSMNVTREELLNQFNPGYRSNLKMLIDQLVAKRFLIEITENTLPNLKSSETNLDIFYWEFDLTTNDVTSILNSKRFVIFGVNYISRQLVSALESSDVHNFQVVDHPLLRNKRLVCDKDVSFEENSRLLPMNGKGYISFSEWENQTNGKEADCFIATSDFGGRQVIQEWNQFCVENKCHFFPVLLQNLIGRVGPLVIPGETACFECLSSRENSHLDAPEIYWQSDKKAFEGQTITGFFPSMATILGDLAAMELVKFYSGNLPRWNVGTLIEVKLLVPQIESHKILKVPRCLVCSPLKNTASSNIKKNKDIAKILSQ